jgi:hypothetical protein
MGIRDRPTMPHSPWQNGHVERLIGSIRRECLDHMVVINAAHLRRVLQAYARYYNESRTHLRWIRIHRADALSSTMERFPHTPCLADCTGDIDENPEETGFDKGQLYGTTSARIKVILLMQSESSLYSIWIE